jgi:hypothetical protein
VVVIECNLFESVMDPDTAGIVVEAVLALVTPLEKLNSPVESIPPCAAGHTAFGYCVHIVVTQAVQDKPLPGTVHSEKLDSNTAAMESTQWD